ncbi:hypothetical protein DFJ74DRAFT_490361 [Hyaloraphidium curvatum]|nr:hypothetical protein DFJ74DRAFT_490361 [Hyaloraphidium curvatum]
MRRSARFRSRISPASAGEGFPKPSVPGGILTSSESRASCGHGAEKASTTAPARKSLMPAIRNRVSQGAWKSRKDESSASCFDGESVPANRRRHWAIPRVPCAWAASAVSLARPITAVCGKWPISSRRIWQARPTFSPGMYDASNLCHKVGSSATAASDVHVRRTCSSDHADTRTKDKIRSSSSCGRVARPTPSDASICASARDGGLARTL